MNIAEEEAPENVFPVKGETFEPDRPTKLKRKGRALAAARSGLREAIDNLEENGCIMGAASARAALKRSYRMETDGAEDGPKQTAA